MEKNRSKTSRWILLCIISVKKPFPDTIKIFGTLALHQRHIYKRRQDPHLINHPKFVIANVEKYNTISTSLIMSTVLKLIVCYPMRVCRSKCVYIYLNATQLLMPLVHFASSPWNHHIVQEFLKINALLRRKTVLKPGLLYKQRVEIIIYHTINSLLSSKVFR